MDDQAKKDFYAIVANCDLDLILRFIRRQYELRYKVIPHDAVIKYALLTDDVIDEVYYQISEVMKNGELSGMLVAGFREQGENIPLSKCSEGMVLQGS